MTATRPIVAPAIASNRLAGGDWATILVAVAAASLPAVMPAMVGAIADQPGIGIAGAGYLVSANMAGILLGSLVAAALVRRLPLRPLLRSGLVAMIAGNGLTLFVAGLPGLFAARLFSGVGEGIAAGLCYAAMSGSARPALLLSFYTAGQSIVGFVGMAALPWLVAWSDWRAFYLGVSVVGLAALPLVGLVPVRDAAGHRRGLATAAPPRAWAMLALIFLFFTGMALIWAFLQRIGGGQGLSLLWVSAALSSSAWAGLIGALIAAPASSRLGRPAAVAIGVALIAATAPALALPTVPAFFAAAWLLSFAWAFLFPFLFRQLAGYGAGGVAALTPVATGSALSAGPAIGGALLAHAGLPAAIAAFLFLSIGALLACLALPAGDAPEKVDS